MGRKKKKKSTTSKPSSSEDSYTCKNCGGNVDPTRNICMRCGAFYNPIANFMEKKFFDDRGANYGWFAEAPSFRGMSNQQIEYNIGLENLEKMRLNEAIEYYDKYVRNNQTDYIAWNNLGAAFMGMKNRKYALECYNNAVKLKPDYYIALYNIGAVHYECRQYEKAIEYFDKAIKVNPKCGEAHWDRHLAKEELGEIDFNFTSKAMAEGINVLRARMNNSSALVDLGNGDDAILGFYYLSLKNQDQLAKYHGEAIKSYENDNIAETLKILKTCISINPDDPTAWTLIGKTSLKLRNYDEALGCFEKSATVDKNSPENWFALGTIHAMNDRFDKAIHCYDEMLRINPFDPNALKGKDTVIGEKFHRLRNSGKDMEAIALLDSVIADNPPDVSGYWVEKGVVYASLKQYGEADTCFNKALEEDPKNYFPWLNKGGISLLQEKFLDAYDCYMEALKIDPNNERAMQGVTRALANTKESQRFEKNLRQHHSKEAVELNEKGTEYLNRKNFDEALGCFNEALQIDAEFSEVWFLKGLLYVEIQDFQNAIESFERIVKLKPDDISLMVDTWVNKGVCHRRLNELDKALECYREAANLDATIIDTWLNMGNIYLEQMNPSKALEYFDKAIDLGSEQGSSGALAKNSKGSALVELKQYHEAIEMFNEALEFNPVFPSAWVGKGVAYQHLGNFNKAIECLDRSISIEPSFLVAWLQKANMLYDLKEFKEALECYNEIMRRDQTYSQPLVRERIEMLKNILDN